MSTQGEKNDFVLAMQDVRGAFRLLYVYTWRILDVMKYVSARLNTSYKGGWPKYSTPSPKSGSGYLESWAWDWLNMYFYEFNFHPIGINHYDFSILLQSDTGFWDGECSELAVESYTSIEQSKTRLIFILGNGYWNIEEFKQDSRLKSTGKYEFRINAPDEEGDGYMLCKIFDIKDFIDRETAEKSLSAYIAYLNLKENGIYDIKLKELE